ncbi:MULTISPECIES: hypothetical protein [Gammaproteobacteria]|uniref:hypothetical protein n=1 Tax=Gammaproteobacteria TaxID=1236 RepID=UPI000DCFE151|nr:MULTISPECIES: hypothetical protein [Gammaproteobacteria]RTE85561.1 hypothetical protein DQX04_11720 [Aliidiomarina sp. B3213]TCZ89531.1 hypothetical protein EYQ95_11650 [Lysobacter sp. N42]
MIVRILIALILLLPSYVTAFQEEGEQSPDIWEGSAWVIAPLQTRDATLFHSAYFSSAPYLYNVLGWGWPTAKITVEMNANMVQHHVSQHNAGASYTYSVRKLGYADIVGAIYINPVNQSRSDVPNYNAQDYEAEMSMWFTQQVEQDEDIAQLGVDIMNWLANEWSFNSVLIPVHENYEFLQGIMSSQELDPFTEDADAGMLLYRYP